MRKQVAGLTVCAFLALTGCSNGMNAEQAEGNVSYWRGAFGPGPLNYEHMQSDPHEPGEVNTGTSYKNMSSNKQSLGDDQDQVREIIETHGFRSGMVILHGSDVYVNVHNDQNWDAGEEETQLKNLRKALQREVPRYDVHLRK
ncbi:hypothetical protein [Shouchella shacheensis]|uniref:hypothetical protein n=1 Tax=Shouchella shacheensis TaxID=1649580 RepID=UPI00073FFD07|nr:hypothetical protein [Shouchella shacheensis]